MIPLLVVVVFFLTTVVVLTDDEALLLLAALPRAVFDACEAAVVAAPRLPRTDPTVDVVDVAEAFVATRCFVDLGFSAGGPIVTECAAVAIFAGEGARVRYELPGLGNGFNGECGSVRELWLLGDNTVDGLILREPFLMARDAVVFVGPNASTLARFFATDKSTFSLSDPIISALSIVRMLYRKTRLITYLERFMPLSRAGLATAM
jgi:hypothetical protein